MTRLAKSNVQPVVVTASQRIGRSSDGWKESSARRLLAVLYAHAVGGTLCACIAAMYQCVAHRHGVDDGCGLVMSWVSHQSPIAWRQQH